MRSSAFVAFVSPGVLLDEEDVPPLSSRGQNFTSRPCSPTSFWSRRILGASLQMHHRRNGSEVASSHRQIGSVYTRRSILGRNPNAVFDIIAKASPFG